MAIEVHRELFITCARNDFPEFLKRLEQRLDTGWERDQNREKGIGLDSGANMFCFVCADMPERPAASLWLTDKDERRWYVSNIVPTILGELSRQQYNRILVEFGQRFALPVAEELGYPAEITSDQLGLENWLEPDTQERLLRFSHAANKSTGSSHPLDKKRWYDFVVSAHAARSELDASTLQRWLIEEQEWPAEIAFDLAVEYESGRDLLRFYDGWR